MSIRSWPFQVWRLFCVLGVAAVFLFEFPVITAWAAAVPLKWCFHLACAEGVGKLENRHFAATINYEGGIISMSGDIVEDQLDVDAVGPLLGAAPESLGMGRTNCTGHGSTNPATGMVSISIPVSCGQNNIFLGSLELDLSAIASTSTGAAAPQPAPPAASLPPLDRIDAIYVAVDPAKVREQPDPLSAHVKTLDAGQKIKVLGRLRGQNWYLVSENDKPIGYVVANQLVPESQYHPVAAPVALADAGPVAATAEPAIPPAIANLDFGRYEALVIGDDRYQGGLPTLRTATADAGAVADVLTNAYGFKVTLLLNATRQQIIGTLARYRRTLTWDDNLLIYYAGHGSYDQEADQGYWLPADATLDDPSNWVSNGDITTMVKAIHARHVLVVADSCYSGTLTRDANVGTKDADYIQRMVEKKARTVMTSGGLEPVADAGSSGHSVFAAAFIAALQQNKGVMDAETFFNMVREPVVLAATQTPQYSNLRFAGHEGGDFIFVRKQ